MKPRPSICKACLHKPFPRTFSATAPQSSLPKETKPALVQKIPIESLQPQDLSYYWDTQPPTSSQLAYADRFFAPSPHTPKKLWSASEFRTTPLSSSIPEVAFLGRSNVGKSSLLNALLGDYVCWTSSKPGRTREMNAFGVGGSGRGAESRLVVLDMPGYGKGSRTEWGVEILKYLRERKQLRRAFLLIDPDHGLKNTDLSLLSLFRTYAIPHQIVLPKADKLLANNKTVKRIQKKGVSTAGLNKLQSTLHSIRPIVQPPPPSPGSRNTNIEGPGALGEVLACSAEMKIAPKRYLGVSALRWAVLKAAGFGGSVDVASASGLSGS